MKFLKGLTVLLTVLLLFFSSGYAQQGPEKPDIFLSHQEMTATGGSFYNHYRWFNSDKAQLKTYVQFTTGSYRFDFSGYNAKGTCIIELLVDGVIRGRDTIDAADSKIYTIFVVSIPTGRRSVTFRLGNFNSGANHCRVGLFYITRSIYRLPYVRPVMTSIALPDSAHFITREHYGAKKLRGFNFGPVLSYSDVTGKNMSLCASTGANVARVWLKVHHDADNNYYFTTSSNTNIGNQSLLALDSIIKLGRKFGIYIIPTIEVYPNQGGCDLWGSTPPYTIRRLNVINQIYKVLANRYKNETYVAGYDLINEPRQVSTNSVYNRAEYLRWQSDAIDSIKTIDSNHVAIVEVLNNSMLPMMVPFHQTNVVYSPHKYTPFDVTHQGVSAYTLASPASETKRLPYPGTAGNYTSAVTSFEDVRTMSRRFHEAIWFGEFGCINWAPKNSNGEWSGVAWGRDQITIMEAEGWSWAFHAWREFEGWDVEIDPSFYNSYTFTNAAPFTQNTRPSFGTWTASRSVNSPMMTMLKKWFLLNP